MTEGETYSKEELEVINEVKAMLAEARRRQDPLRIDINNFLLGLLRARHKKGLSQVGLAKRIGKQQSVIARIESGKGNPSLRTLIAIAKALDLHLVLE